MTLSGEETQERGRDGVRLAKAYLESTGRADVVFDNPSKGAAHLKFTKEKFAQTPDAQGAGFSFDCGGILQGEGVEGMTFLAEVKKYATEGGQGSEYTLFLAKCYRAIAISPRHADKFLWITWHPFSQTKWSQLLAWEHMKDVISKSEKAKEIAVGESGIDDDLCKSVAGRLVIIVLSDRQLDILQPTRDERNCIRAALIKLRDV
jgi:hypothetical protein